MHLTNLLGKMSPLEFCEVFDIPNVIMVKALLFATNWVVIHCHGNDLCYSLVGELYPSLSVVAFLVATKLPPTFAYGRV